MNYTNLIWLAYKVTSSFSSVGSEGKDMDMLGGILGSFMKWLCSHLWFSDMAMALLGLFIISSLLERFTNKGPMLWPVMGIIPSLVLHVNDVYDWITKALIKCGGTFHYRGTWMGSSGLVTADPSKIEYMLKTRFKNFPKGSYYRERFHDLLGGGIFNADDDLWKLQRRIAISEMHSDRFVAYTMQTIQGLVHQKLLKLMEKLAISKDCIDLQEVLLRFTFDNICIAAFGIDPGCLSLDLPDVLFAKAFEEATELTLLRFLIPCFIWKPMKILGIGFEKRLKDAVEVVHDFAEKTVRQRKNVEANDFDSLNSRSDLLSRLINSGYLDENVKTKFFPDKFLKDFCISFILAGRDTGSVALAWFFWLVHENPQVERQILDEIKVIISYREAKIDETPSEIVFTTEELKRMVYLEAALSEALRLYPPVPIDLKEVLEDDVFPDGTLVKQGSKIFYSIFSMARTESIWGKDCQEFKPERWIKDGKLVSENQFKYPVFNAGPRLCVGKKFAYMQMKMVAASILLRYSLKVVEGHDAHPKLTTTLYMKHGLLVTLEPRFGLI